MITYPFNSQAPSLPVKPYKQSIEFTGTTSEYFRIWVVNIFLSIVTLGIYSAWATVRTRKYFYQHTRLLGQGFDFHGDPKRILKSRLIAAAVYLCFSFIPKMWPLSWKWSLIAFYLALPAVIVQALRFRMSNTSYRSIRFGFAGKFRQACAVYFLYPIAAALSLGLALPALTCRAYRYWVSGVRFGTQAAETDLSTKQFCLIYLKALGISLLSAAIYGTSIYLFYEQRAGLLTLMLSIIPVVIVLFFWLLIRPYLKTNFQNLLYNNTHFGGLRFKSSLRFRGVFWLSLTNFLMIALSFGLLVPYTKVRSARYMAERLEVFGPDSQDMDKFVAGISSNPTATGDGLVDLFGIDIPAIG